MLNFGNLVIFYAQLPKACDNTDKQREVYNDGICFSTKCQVSIS